MRAVSLQKAGSQAGEKTVHHHSHATVKLHLLQRLLLFARHSTKLQCCSWPCKAGSIWCSSSSMEGSLFPKYILVLLEMAFM